jgi:purine-binding chemotaxis protein CheW
MEQLNHLVTFRLDELRLALHLPVVERVVRAVEITPLPGAPEMVLGVVNVQGQIVPVIDIRRCLSLPERKINLDDELIIARTLRRSVALVVDDVTNVIEGPAEEMTATEVVFPGIGHIQGIMRLPDGLILIVDLGGFLSIEEDSLLDEAIEIA